MSVGNFVGKLVPRRPNACITRLVRRIFATAIYVNLAAIYLFGLFAFGIAYIALHNRTTEQLCKALIVIGVSGAALVAAKDLYPQVYRQAGRNGDTVWARILVSMGVSP